MLSCAIWHLDAPWSFCRLHVQSSHDSVFSVSSCETQGSSVGFAHSLERRLGRRFFSFAARFCSRRSSPFGEQNRISPFSSHRNWYLDKVWATEQHKIMLCARECVHLTASVSALLDEGFSSWTFCGRVSSFASQHGNFPKRTAMKNRKQRFRAGFNKPEIPRQRRAPTYVQEIFRILTLHLTRSRTVV